MYVAVTMSVSAVPVVYWGKLQKIDVSSFCLSFGLQGSEGYVFCHFTDVIIQSFAVP